MEGRNTFLSLVKDRFPRHTLKSQAIPIVPKKKKEEGEETKEEKKDAAFYVEFETAKRLCRTIHQPQKQDVACAIQRMIQQQRKEDCFYPCLRVRAAYHTLLFTL